MKRVHLLCLLLVCAFLSMGAGCPITSGPPDPQGGVVTGIISTGNNSTPVADGTRVTCIDGRGSGAFPFSDTPSDGVANSGRYRCSGVYNGTYQLEANGVQADPGGDCDPVVNNSTETCNANVTGGCNSPQVAFSVLLLPLTFLTSFRRRLRARHARTTTDLTGRA